MFYVIISSRWNTYCNIYIIYKLGYFNGLLNNEYMLMYKTII